MAYRVIRLAGDHESQGALVMTWAEIQAETEEWTRIMILVMRECGPEYEEPDGSIRDGGADA